MTPEVGTELQMLEHLHLECPRGLNQVENGKRICINKANDNKLYANHLDIKLTNFSRIPPPNAVAMKILIVSFAQHVHNDILTFFGEGIHAK